jgi:hypothetical protein
MPVEIQHNRCLCLVISIRSTEIGKSLYVVTVSSESTFGETGFIGGIEREFSETFLIHYIYLNRLISKKIVFPFSHLVLGSIVYPFSSIQIPI